LKAVPKTAKTIIRRYLSLNPDFKENYVDFLLKIKDYDEAAVYLTKVKYLTHFLLFFLFVIKIQKANYF